MNVGEGLGVGHLVTEREIRDQNKGEGRVQLDSRGRM